MNYEVNKLYGILTDGDTFIRNTTMNRKRAPKNVKNIVEALIPPVLDANTRRALAEFYLRMIFTDKPLIAALTQYDPINSYQLHSFYPEYADTFDIDIIVKGVKSLGCLTKRSPFSRWIIS